MGQRYKAKRPPALKPHVEYGDYDNQKVVVVRIPQGTHRQIKDKVLDQQRQMAKAESSYWVNDWMEGLNG